MDERTKIKRSIINAHPREPEPRPLLPHIDLHQKKPFVVPERHVVPRTIFLDELPLQKQRLRLGENRVPLKIPDTLEQSTGLGISSHPTGRHEILRHALFEVARLANIDDTVESVAHEIHSRLVRHLAQL